MKIADSKIVPSLHIYPPAWNQVMNRHMQKEDIDDLASAGRSLIVGEFGSLPAGNTDWAGIVQYAKSKGYEGILRFGYQSKSARFSILVKFLISNFKEIVFLNSISLILHIIKIFAGFGPYKMDARNSRLALI